MYMYVCMYVCRITCIYIYIEMAARGQGRAKLSCEPIVGGLTEQMKDLTIDG